MVGKSFVTRISCPILLSACTWLPLATTQADAADPKAFLPKSFITSTIPGNGDLNPYGVAFVPSDFPSFNPKHPGKISPGMVLVSNFNVVMNCQGRGTTIIQFDPNNADGSVAGAVPATTSPGNATTFFQGSQLGLTTALGVLKGGFVIVGNVASPDDGEGCVNTALPGVLQVIDRNGTLVNTLIDTSQDGSIYGSPWDLVVTNDKGSSAQVFVSNALTGTVGRLDLTITATNVTVQQSFVVAGVYPHPGDPVAFVLAPTGVLLDHLGNLLVASTFDNKIFKVPNVTKPVPPPATIGTVLFSDPHLRGPLALAFTPLGNILTSNGDAENSDTSHPSEIVEFTPAGVFVREFNIDAGTDAAFGIATETTKGFPIDFNFAYVNDNNNTLAVRVVPVP
jgi:hypothetical protein